MVRHVLSRRHATCAPGAQGHQLVAPEGITLGHGPRFLHQLDPARVARQAIEIRAEIRRKAFEPRERARGVEHLGVQLDGGVRGEDACAAARMLLSCAAHAARCRCRGRSAGLPLIAASTSAVRSGSVFRTGRQYRCGRMPPANSALRFSSRCCGVMVAPTPSRAPRTNCAAAAVVMCSNTMRSFGKRCTRRSEHLVDEARFAIEHVDRFVRDFAVHLQRHADFAHAGEHVVDARDVRDAGIGIRGRAGRVELEAVDEAARLGAIHFRRLGAIGEIERHQRLERRAGGQRIEDALRYAAASAVVVTGGLRFGMMIARANRSRREGQHRAQRVAVPNVEVPVVRLPQA